MNEIVPIMLTEKIHRYKSVFIYDKITSNKIANVVCSIRNITYILDNKET